MLKNTARGLITKTINAKSAAVFQLYSNCKSSMLMFAANKINKIEINKMLKDSLKYSPDLFAYIVAFGGSVNHPIIKRLLKKTTFYLNKIKNKYN